MAENKGEIVEDYVDEAEWDRYPYDPELERKWWGFIKEHDRHTYREQDLLVIRNRQGLHHTFIPKRQKTLESGQRVQIVEHPDRGGKSISLIEIDPVTRPADFQRTILVDRRPREFRE